MNQAFKLKRHVALLAIAATFIPVWSRAQDQDLSGQLHLGAGPNRGRRMDARHGGQSFRPHTHVCSR